MATRKVYVLPEWLVDSVRSYIREKDSYQSIGHLNQVAYFGEKIVALVAAEDSPKEPLTRRRNADRQRRGTAGADLRRASSRRK